MNNEHIILEDYTDSSTESYTVFSESGNPVEINYDLDSINLLLGEDTLLLDEGVLDVASDNPLGGVLPSVANDLGTALAILGNSLCLIPRNAESVDVEITKKLLEEYLSTKKGDFESRGLRLYNPETDIEKFNEAIKSKSFRNNVTKFFKLFAEAALLFTVTTVGFKALIGDFKNSKKNVKEIIKTQKNKEFIGPKSKLKDIIKSGFRPMKNKWMTYFKSLFDFSGKKVKVSSQGKKDGLEYGKALTKIAGVTLVNSMLSCDSYFVFKIDNYTLITFFPKNAISMNNYLYPGYLVLTNVNSGDIVFDSVNVCGKHID